MASAERLSALQCRHAPTRPSAPNATASARCTPPAQSLAHCQLKYCHHMAICAAKSACRSVTGGLAYCVRLSTESSAAQLVGSPSLIAGKCGARSSRNSHRLTPRATATAAQARNLGLRNTRGSV